MNIIIPMAGMGKRMRPHTLTIPKPLLPVAGKPIVQRLVEDIAKVCGKNIEHIAFVVGKFGNEVEQKLLAIAESIGAQGAICYQEEPLGTAHAVLCAKEFLDRNVVIAFADTLFRADFTLDEQSEGIVWVQKVNDPRSFGVVKLNENQEIIEFVEKPQTFVSDLAIIGIYYLKDGEFLRRELQYLIDNNLKEKGEYQLTNALENMKKKGLKFKIGRVTEWLDCGNKDATVHTNQRYLEYLRGTRGLISPSSKTYSSLIIEPVFLGDNVEIENSIIGPYVSVGNNTKIVNSIIQNSIIQDYSFLKDVKIQNSMIGSYVHYEGKFKDVSLGDYNYFKE
ncbi:MAG: sugar phosphate nucleotidyltransferase [Microscillaceae bacterium]|nr:sugar phosphate nucleotidyltransferase [Microscillaceae bacterium]MDW8460142.1 sugar phosphate nucleotidyltransferase [Cytophagales bacterium]